MLWISSIFIYHIKWDQRPKICRYLTPFTACLHPRVWHLFFLHPVPSLLCQAVVSFLPHHHCRARIRLCWRGRASCHGFQQSQELELAAEFCHGWQESPACSFPQSSREGSIWKQTGRFCSPQRRVAPALLAPSCGVVGGAEMVRRWV